MNTMNHIQLTNPEETLRYGKDGMLLPPGENTNIKSKEIDSDDRQAEIQANKDVTEMTSLANNKHVYDNINSQQLNTLK